MVFSDQYIVEIPVLHKVAAEAGLAPILSIFAVPDSNEKMQWY
jgi:hypothetical protein